jgi:O-antigen/teichoic acid export membrane protein
MPKFLNPEEIGLLRLLQDVPLLLGSFIQFGAANITDKFFPNFKTDDGKHNGFLLLILTYSFLGYLFFLMSYYIFQDQIINLYISKSPLFVNYINYLIPLSLFTMYTSVMESYSRAHLRIVVPAIIREVLVRILYTFMILGYAFAMYNYEGVVIIFIMSYAVALLLLMVYVSAFLPFKIHWDTRVLNKDFLRTMGTYVLYIIPGSAGSLLASKIDTLMIGSKLGLAEIGIYNLAFFIGSIVEMPRRAISQISLPILAQAWSKNNLEEIRTIYKKSSINQMMLGGIVFVLIWTNVDMLLSLIPNSEIYSKGKYVILFIGLGRLFDMSTGVNTEIILSSPYYRFNLISIALLSILSVITNLIFIDSYGINGVAFATFLTLIVFNAIKLIFLKVKIDSLPIHLNSLKLLMLLLAFLYIGSLITFDNQGLWNTLIIISVKSIIMTSLLVATCYYFKLSDDFNTLLNKLIKGIKK